MAWWAIVLCCWLIPITAQEIKPEDETLRIAAGMPGWAYWRYAEEIQKILGDRFPGLEIHLVKTSGSAESLELIAKQKVDLAIIQNNAAYASTFSTERIRGLSTLYTEAIQIFGVHYSPMERSADLHGLRIYVGEKGSGTYEDSRRTLNILGVLRTEYTPVIAPFEELSDLVGANQVDAGILVDAVPSTDILSLPSSTRFLSLSSNEIRDLLGEYSYLVPYSIPPGTYPGQLEEVQTVGVRALLVCDQSFSGEWITALLEGMAASQVMQTLAEEFGGDWNTPIMSARGMSFSLHPAAKTSYRYKVLFHKLMGQWLSDIILIMGVVLIWTGVVYSRKSFFRSIRRNMSFRLITIFASIYVLATSSIHLSEQNNTPGFQSLRQSFWSTSVYVLIGLESSREPRTSTGKVGVAALLIASVGLLGSITGKFASMFIHNRRKVMPNDTSKHIVICNWNSRGDKIIRELHALDAAPDTDIVVISREDICEEDLRVAENNMDVDYYSRVFFVKSDPQLPNVLRSARVQFARCVMILSDEHSPDPDANSAIVALALQEVLGKDSKEIPRKSPHIVAESLNHRKIPHLKGAGVNEVVCAEDYGVGILSQCALHHQLSEVYDRLLHYTDDTSELYIVENNKLPKWLPGKTYKEVSMAVYTQRDPDNPCIPLGIQREEGKILLNPLGNEESIIFEPGDRLIVLAFEPPNLSRITQ